MVGNMVVDEVNLSPKDFPGVHVCLFYIFFNLYILYIFLTRRIIAFFSFLAKPYPGE